LAQLLPETPSTVGHLGPSCSIGLSSPRWLVVHRLGHVTMTLMLSFRGGVAVQALSGVFASGRDRARECEAGAESCWSVFPLKLWEVAKGNEDTLRKSFQTAVRAMLGTIVPRIAASVGRTSPDATTTLAQEKASVVACAGHAVRWSSSSRCASPASCVSRPTPVQMWGSRTAE